MLEQIKNTDSLEDLQALYAATFGKSGSMTLRLKEMKNLDNDARAALNAENAGLRDAFKIRQSEIENSVMMAELARQKLDASLSPEFFQDGKLHPTTMVVADINEAFSAMGYKLATGPEIEDDWHNFTALNTPEYHPARDMQDTFRLTNGNVVRTQTSAVQIREMEKNGVPVKIFCPGAVYRNDMDATHIPSFHQVEGLVIDRNTTMRDLISDIKKFFENFFNSSEIAVRIRPSYFPFTEPSIEYDIGWDKKTGKPAIGRDWLEMGGAGMVHPNVLKNVGVNPDEFQGFAFGLGIDRLAMLKYGLNDLRKFYDGDIRWLVANGFDAN